MQIRMGDKIVEAELNEQGIPVIKATTKEIRHPDGRVDVVVEVPCLQIQGGNQNG